jgi:hypothetical protein
MCSAAFSQVPHSPHCDYLMCGGKGGGTRIQDFTVLNQIQSLQNVLDHPKKRAWSGGGGAHKNKQAAGKPIFRLL